MGQKVKQINKLNTFGRVRFEITSEFMKGENTMQTVSVKSIETAVRIYNSKTELLTSDIKELFGLASDSAVLRLKKQVWEVMAKKDIRCWNKSAVNTQCAYEVWKLDIKELEKMYEKLKHFNMLT